MRLHRFYINQEIGSKNSFEVESPELVNQIHSVFRLKSGDEVILFDGFGSDYLCRISDFDKNSIKFDVESLEKSRYMPRRRVYLFASIVKKDNFEWIVEKATELGVTDIIPVISERSEKKSLNEARLRKIAIEASEQCGRGNVPQISEILNFKSEIFENIKYQISNIKNLVAFHTESSILAKEYLKDVGDDESVGIFIGPEGGYSDNEIEIFRNNDIPVVSLGSQVLRAETAVISALSQVLL
jgi:16S rRNA (uracil1498-N3)-methyltransferase